MAAAVEIDAEIQQQLTNEVKLFNRWSFDEVSVISSSIQSLLSSYICLFELLKVCNS